MKLLGRRGTSVDVTAMAKEVRKLVWRMGRVAEDSGHPRQR